MRNMNIGIDFDDTIADDPELFKNFSSTLSTNDKIYIISSCDRQTEPFIDDERKTKEEKLNAWGIRHDGLFFALDPIPQGKAKLCIKHKISLMIDDNEDNLEEIRKSSPSTLCLRYTPKSSR